MDFKKFIVFFGFIILIVVSALFAFAEEPVVAPKDVTVSADQQAVPKNANDTQWAWGEVTNVDLAAKTLTLKYLDYESDQEKDLVLTVDEKTTFENIKTLDDVKIKDTLSIDYVVAADGKNIAKNINFEQPDAVPASPDTAAAPIAKSTDLDQPPAVQPEVVAPAPATPVTVPPVPEVTPVTEVAPTTEVTPAAAETTSVSAPVPAAQEGQAQ